jgi:hypothetical protein
MNELFRHAPPSDRPARPATTQAADGLPRRAWTVDEVARMIELGILDEPEPFELIGGELVAMAAKNRQHEVLRTELGLNWGRRCPLDLKIAQETPLRLGDCDAPEPDLIVFPASLRAPDVRADRGDCRSQPGQGFDLQGPTVRGGWRPRVLGDRRC